MTCQSRAPRAARRTTSLPLGIKAQPTTHLALPKGRARAREQRAAPWPRESSAADRLLGAGHPGVEPLRPAVDGVDARARAVPPCHQRRPRRRAVRVREGLGEPYPLCGEAVETGYLVVRAAETPGSVQPRSSATMKTMFGRTVRGVCAGAASASASTARHVSKNQRSPRMGEQCLTALRHIDESARVPAGSEQEGSRGARGRAASLLPLLERARRDAQQTCELRLRQFRLFRDGGRRWHCRDASVLAALELTKPPRISRRTSRLDAATDSTSRRGIATARCAESARRPLGNHRSVGPAATWASANRWRERAPREGRGPPFEPADALVRRLASHAGVSGSTRSAPGRRRAGYALTGFLHMP